MALSIINTPLKIAPVYNPNYFIVDSTNKGNDNFEYLFDVYESNGLTLGDRLIRVRVPQEPISGWGVYNPSKILQTQIENVFNKDLTGCTPQDYLEYSIFAGEAYTFNWPFTSVFGLNVTGSTCLLNLVLTGTTQHYYQVGDFISLTGSTIPQYNGTWEILQIPNNQQVVLNLCVSSLSSTSGSTRLFNDEQTFFSGLTSFTEYYAHNAAIGTYDFIPYRVEPFVRDTYYPSISGTSLWYTNCPDGYKTRITNRGTFGYFHNIYTGATYPEVDILRVITNDGGDFEIDLGCKKEFIDVGVFPWNLNNTDAGDITILSGTLPIIKSTTTSYTISLQDSGTTLLNQAFTFNIYEYCNKWDNYEFVFMDRKNCWVPMNFELVQRKNVGLDRKTFKKGLEYNYGYLDRGETVVQNIITYNYTITSNWFDEATSLYFEELMTSPEVYWNYEGTGEFIPINLTITNEEIKNKRNTRLIQYTLQFQYSNNPIGMLG